MDTHLKLQVPVQTIVTLSPHLAELVFAAGAGDKLIATVDHSDYPEKAKQVPALGAYNKWDVEQVLALNPDIVLAWQTANGEQPIKKLRQLGLKVYVSEPRAVEDVASTIRHIGLMTGNPQIAEQKADKYLQGMRRLEQQFAHRKPVDVFYQVWSNPLITINDQQLISRLIQLCGGRNSFGTLPVLAPTVSIESLIQANPDIIVGAAKAAEHGQWLQNWQQWPSIKAVKNSRLYFINPDLLNRQTTRMLDGATRLCTMIEQARQEGAQ